MLAYYGGFFSEWEANEKVEFDGPNSLIIVHDNVTTLDIRKDVWSAAVRWLAALSRGNDRFHEPMDRTGLDPVPGGTTGDSYFLINGWKLIVDFSKVKITGVLFSRDFDTAYYTSNLTPQYAAQVSSIVNTVDVPFLPTDVDVDAPVWVSAEGIANAYQNGKTINISWGKARDASPVSYNIYMSKFTHDVFESTNLHTSIDGYFHSLTGFNNESFIDSTTYYIGVRAVDIYGNETDNTNYGTVVYNEVSVLTTEQNSALMLTKYQNKAIYVDSEVLVNGDGSATNPFDNVGDAKDFAEANGILTVYLYSDVIIPSNVKNFTIIGIGSPVVDCNGQDLKNTEFVGVKLRGTYTDRIKATRCSLDSDFHLNGGFQDCAVFDNVTCIDSGLVTMTNCFSNVGTNGVARISLNGLGSSKLSVINFGGDLVLENVDNVLDYVKVTMPNGHLDLAATCTDGHIEVSGHPIIVNNSGPGCTVNLDAAIVPATQVDTIVASQL